MKNSKLIQVLETLSKVEIREFKKYLQSPLHNQRADVQQLLSLLLTKKATTPFPNKQYFHQALFPAQPFDVITLFYLRFIENNRQEEEHIWQLLSQMQTWKI